jgi:hypothetical protein
MLLQNLHINLTLSFGLFFRPLAHCPPPVAFTLPRTSFSLASHTSLASCVLWDNVLCRLLNSVNDSKIELSYVEIRSLAKSLLSLKTRLKTSVSMSWAMLVVVTHPA